MSVAWHTLCRAAEDVLVVAGWQALYATLLFLLLLPVTRWLARRWPQRSASLRQALWTLVLVRLLLPPGLALPGSAGALFGPGGALDPRPWLLEWGGGEEGVVEGLHGAFPDQLPGTARGRGGDPSSAPPWAPPLVALWAVGATLAFERRCRRRRAYRRLAEGSPEASTPELEALLGRWCERHGIVRPVRLAVTGASVPPFTLGVGRPTVVLPAELLRRRQPGLIEAVLAHELAHVARRDDLWLLAEQGIEALWFFHPLVRAATRRLRAAREQACDGRVLARGQLTPTDYGRHLLTVVGMGLDGAIPAPTFPSRQRSLAMRLRGILEHSDDREPRVVPAVVVAVLTGLFLLPLAPYPAASAEAAGKPTVSKERFANPLPAGRMTSPFGKRVHPISGESAHHAGVDLAARPGTPVRATAPGVVVVATRHYAAAPHHGTVVLIDHGDGWTSLYTHLASLEVAEGEHLAAGQQLGTVGSTGESTGAHLHFELRHDGEPVDPGRRVRAWR